MKWNLVRLELALNKRSWIIGAFVILLFQAIYGGSAKVYTENDALLEKLNTLPSAMLDAFGIRLDLMGSYEGWMSGQPFTFYVLLLGAFGSIWASSGIARERDQNTGDYLFALPYSRWQVYLSKATAHWIQVTVISILNLLLMLQLGLYNGMENPASILLLAAAGYMIVLAFAGIGYGLTVFLHTERAALSAGIGLVLISFLLNMISTMSDNLSWMAGISLFHSFATGRIVTEHALTVPGIMITLGIYSCGMLVGDFMLRRQDV